MPKLKENQVPSYRLHKQSGQAVVTLNGRDILLGKHGSARSKSEYRRLTAEWLGTKGLPPSITGDDLTVSELILAFWRHAQTYYRKPDGTQTSEVGLLKQVLHHLRRVYGHTRAADFGPRCLTAMMHEMIRLGWCRNSINTHAGRIRRVFKWAVENEMVPPSVHYGLMAVRCLPKGRTDARETGPVKPVPEENIDAIRPHVSKQVEAMIDLQLLTGARPGEVCEMRGCDIDTAGRIWTCTPASHKTQHHGHEHPIYLGPKAQALVKKFLKPNLQAHLFSPADAEAVRRVAAHAARKTPLSCGNIPGSKRRRGRPMIGTRYTVASYRRAIERACEVAFGMPVELCEPRGKEAEAQAALPDDERDKLRRDRQRARSIWREAHCWHPHQLRHNAGTRLRKEYGLEAAQVILGHKTLTVTQIYAEKNVEAARRVMAEVG